MSNQQTYGYARVSSQDQSLARQMDALVQFPVKEELIFADKASGKDFERPAYKRMLELLQPNDVVVIKSIDRLGRNYHEILEQWRLLSYEKQVGIVVIDMPLLDTRKKDGDLTGTFLADVILQLLSYVAQVERDNIRQRQAEGIAAAHARGVKFGRPSAMRPSNYQKVKARYDEGLITRKEAAHLLGVSVTTFYKWRKTDEQVSAPFL